MLLHLVFGNEAQAGTVDAVAQAAAILGAVGEDVAEVGMGGAAAHFGAVHMVAVVVVLGNGVGADGAGEAGPAAMGIEFVAAAEQGLSADDIDIQAGLEQVVILVAEGAFGITVLGNAVLLVGERAAQGGVVGLAVGSGIKAFDGRAATFGRLERLIGQADVDVAIAVGVFGEVVLMVGLGGIEVLQRQGFHHDGAAIFALFGSQGGAHGLGFGRVGVVDAGAVLAAAVVALLIKRGRVDYAEVVA